MTRPVSRRRFLATSSGAIAAAPLTLGLGPASTCRAGRPPGSLVPTTAEGSQDTFLSLPPGFTYHVVQRAGMPMSDGVRAPNLPDGMICSQLKNGHIALMRNHEIGALDPNTLSALPSDKTLFYDPHSGGGVSRVVLDPTSARALSSNMVLSGTSRNCAGGASPFGYLSCEEDVRPGHGYVFLCDPEADTLMAPRRLQCYGRFNHEAATVDPRTNIAYLTEDRRDSAFYRFLPDDKTSPFVGQLQALAVVDRPRADTASAPSGTRYPVTWVDIPDGDPAEDTVRYQAFKNGAARFVRGEGIWLNGPELFFSATEGGPIARGQIFRLHIDRDELSVIAATEDVGDLDMPDNLTVSPHGLLVVAEDGPAGNYLRVITPKGNALAFAKNIVSPSEFAGPCFSPDGKFLFVNIQVDGLTLAIKGPFQELSTWTPGVNASGSAIWPAPGVIGGSAGLALVAMAAVKMRRGQRRDGT